MKFSPGKKLLFSAVIIAGAVIFVELFAFIGYSLVHGQLYSRAKVLKIIRGQSGSISEFERSFDSSVNERFHLMKETIHPYLGYVLDKEKSEVDVSELGFLKSSNTVIPERQKGKLIVAVLGGSFANSTFSVSSGKFIDFLGCTGADVDILNLALPGYKQPQQLMVLSYFLSMGAEFDVVINIDGFNEVVLPEYDNLPAGVSFNYPRAWNLRTDTAVNPDNLKLVGKIALVDEKRKKIASFFENKKLYYSVTLSLLWMAEDRALRRERRQIVERLESGTTLKTSSYESGTGFAGKSPELYEEKLIDCWVNSSVQLQYLCNENKIKYFHFLQPNQYVEGSKPMGDEERDIAIDFDHPYAPYAIKGYPHLIRAGNRLIEKNVNYFDLTMIFADNSDVLYGDSCCHLNRKGYDLVASHIGSLVRDDLIQDQLFPCVDNGEYQ